MKNKSLKMLLALCLVIPSLFLFSGCKVKLNSFNLSIRLNNNQASYTQQYKDTHGYSSNNVTHILNPDKYDKIEEKLPRSSDMIAPEGKVFAGWYLSSECGADTYFNKANWTKLVAEKKQAGSKSASVYAYWIDEEYVSLSFDLNDSNATFKNDYKSELSINHNTPRFVGDPSELLEENLPLETDINIPEGKTFDGWYLNAQLTIPLNETTIVNMSTTGADLRVYAKWTNRVEVSTIIFTAPYESPQPLSSFVFSEEIRETYDDDIFPEDISYSVYRDEFSKVETLLSTLPEEIETNSAAYTFDGWKIVTWEQGNVVLIDFNQQNWEANTQVGTNQDFTAIQIVATWIAI